MKRVNIRVFNYQSAESNYDYTHAISYPSEFFFAITNSAITHYSKKGYKTPQAAKSAAKAYRKHLKALGMI